jgi:nicotinamide-nucleotide adenylyltransferase
MARDAVVEELKRTEGKGVRLLLLLAVQNADKAPKPAGFEQRLAIMWAFARDVRSSINEKVRGGPGDAGAADVAIDVGLTTKPFFHEKSEAIAQSDFYKETAVKGEKVQEKMEMEQVVLAGYDTLIRIFSPKYYGEAGIKKALGPFFDRVRLRVTMRTDADWGNSEEQMGYVDELLRGDGLEKVGGRKEWAGKIEIDEKKMGVEAGVVSSTLAREAAKKKDWNRVGELVPGEVRKWVEREELYAEDE